MFRRTVVRVGLQGSAVVFGLFASFLNRRADIDVVIGWGDLRAWDHDHLKRQSTVDEEATRKEEVEEHGVKD